jgi:hypothetical protein
MARRIASRPVGIPNTDNCPADNWAAYQRFRGLKRREPIAERQTDQAITRAFVRSNAERNRLLGIGSGCWRVFASPGT